MIPDLLLEEILLGEKKAQDYYEKYGKEEIENALQELRKSNQEILNIYPAEKMQKEFIKKSLVVKGTKSFKSVKYISYAAAALIAAALFVPVAMNNLKATSSKNITRAKGSVSKHQELRLYKKSGNDAVILKNGTDARENDVIQITYLAGEYNYGVIFSVDGSGNVTRHFPEDSWKAEKLQKTGAEVPLEFSYKLDAAPKYECFIFVASKNSFDMSKIENVDKNKYSIEYLKNGSYLPSECESSVFVLNKK